MDTLFQFLLTIISINLIYIVEVTLSCLVLQFDALVQWFKNNTKYINYLRLIMCDESNGPDPIL